MNQYWEDLRTRISTKIRQVEDLLLSRRISPYGVAVGRILGGATYLGILLTNFGSRQLLFGDAAAWSHYYRDSENQTPWTKWVGFLGDLPGFWFTVVYLAVMAVGVAFILGWWTRVTGALLLIGAIQILELNPMIGDQGDNILRIGILYILLTDCGGVWSLDARRRRRADREGQTTALTQTLAIPRVRTAVTVLHNVGVILLATELITVYISAAMFKIPGDPWRYGSAIASPLRLDEYRVWPLLNDMAVSLPLMVWFMTYASVYLQLYFPVLLLNKWTRRPALVGVILLHLGIAVMMGLPWFTLAMMAFDGIFVSTATYLALERFFGKRVRQLLDRRRKPALEPELEPA